MPRVCFELEGLEGVGERLPSGPGHVMSVLLVARARLLPGEDNRLGQAVHETHLWNYQLYPDLLLYVWADLAPHLEARCRLLESKTWRDDFLNPSTSTQY
jgi:hypothetical protein